MAVDPLFDSIPSNWLSITLGEACALSGGNIQTGPFGSQLHASDYVPVGIPSIMPLNIGDNRVVADDIARIKQADAERLSRYRVQTGDIVYSRRGDVERRALIRTEEDGWLCGTGCLRVRFGIGNVDPMFASFYLGHPAVREWIVRHAVGATMPNLNTSILSALPFVIPPLPEQRAIAHVLGTLDDKIELNRKMNETLEAMARALFKSWFVDFDPVRAKAEGRQPAGMDAETAALFPDAFEATALGEVPRGWRIGKLKDLVQLINERAEPTPEKNSERYIALDDMPSKSIDITTYRSGAEVNSSIIRFRKGDILFGSMRPYFHKVGQAFFDGITRTTTFVLRPHNVDLAAFALLQFFSDEVVEFSTTASVGTTIPYIRWDALRDYEVVIPSDQILATFQEITSPLIQMIGTNGEQSRALAALRDALLPKLMSGEVRVNL